MAERLIFEIRLKGLAFGERGLGLWLGVIQMRKSPYFSISQLCYRGQSSHCYTFQPPWEISVPVSRPRQTHPIRTPGWGPGIRIFSGSPGDFHDGEGWEVPSWTFWARDSPRCWLPWYIEPRTGFSERGRALAFNVHKSQPSQQVWRCLQPFQSTLFFFFGQTVHVACRISVSWPRIEPRPRRRWWQILTSRPAGNSWGGCSYCPRFTDASRESREPEFLA